jgi:hypothetical protein
MDYQPNAAEQIEMRLSSRARELDELCLMAANTETADLIETNVAGVAQVYERCKQIALHIAARRRMAA